MRWFRIRRRFLLPVLLVYALVMFLGGCADRLMLFPPRGPTQTVASQALNLPFQGGNLEIWTQRCVDFAGAEPAGYVLAFGGNGTRADQPIDYLAWRWRGRNVEIWSVNYPGYGASTGPARLNAIAPAILFAYDQLRARAGTRPIYLEGQSLGTSAALCVAARRPVAGLVLQSPPPLRQMVLQRFGWWNLWLLAGPVALQVPNDLGAVANGHRVKAPAIFIFTDADTIVPPKYQQMVIDAYAGPKRVIHLPGTDHNDGLTPAQEQQVEDSLPWLVQPPGVGQSAR